MKRIICLFLAILMLLGAAGCGKRDPGSGSGKPSQSSGSSRPSSGDDSGENNALPPLQELEREATAALSTENPVAEFSGGVRVDFSSDGLTAAEELKVARSEVVGDGVTNTVTYSFSFGAESVDLPMLVEVTLPCQPEWDPEEVSVECYDEELGMWVPVWSEPDPESGTVTFWPDHFSEYRLVAWDDNFVKELMKTPADKRPVYFYATANPGPNDPVYLDTAALRCRIMQKLDPKSIQIPKEKKEYINTGMDVIGFCTDAGGEYTEYLKLVGEATYRTEAISEGLNRIGTVGTFVKMLYNYARTGDIMEVLKDSWDDLAQLVTDYVLEKVGSAALSNVAALFWLMYQAQKALNEQVSFAMRLGGKDEIDYAYRKFTMDYVALSPSTRQTEAFYDPANPTPWYAEMKLLDRGGDWVRIVPASTSLTEAVISIFKTSPGMQRSWSQVLTEISAGVRPDQPGVLLDRLNTAIDNYCNAFWNLDKTTLNRYLAQQTTSDGSQKLADVWKAPSAKERKEYTDKLKAQIYAANKEVFRPLIKKAYYAMCNALYAEARDQLALLNQNLTFTLKDTEKENFSDSVFARGSIVLRQFEFPKETCSFQAANGYVFTCTRYAWLLMARGNSRPKYVDVQLPGEELQTFEFTFTDPNTVISLTAPPEPEYFLKEFSGDLYFVSTGLGTPDRDVSGGCRVTVSNDRLTLTTVGLSDAHQRTMMDDRLRQQYISVDPMTFYGTITEKNDYSSYGYIWYHGVISYPAGFRYNASIWKEIYDSWLDDYVKVTFRLRLEDCVEKEFDLTIYSDGYYDISFFLYGTGYVMDYQSEDWEERPNDYAYLSFTSDGCSDRYTHEHYHGN